MNKKSFSILLVTVMLLALAACGGKDEAPAATVSESFSVPLAEAIPGTVYAEDETGETNETMSIQSAITDMDATEADMSGLDNRDTAEAAEELNAIDAIGHIPNSTAYEQYNNLSGEDQTAFMESFDSVEAFVAWFNAAQAEYEAANPAIEITGDGVIDLSEYAN